MVRKFLMLLMMIGFAQLALRHGFTVSNFHFSRDDLKRLNDQIEYADEHLRNGNPEEDTIYVLRKDEFEERGLIGLYSGLEYIYTDNEVIGVAEGTLKPAD